MGKTLSAFFAQNIEKLDVVPFVVSKRFKENGEAVEWQIGCITAGENNRLRQNNMRQVGKRGQTTQQFDSGAYQTALAVRCTIYPALDDQELQDSYGVRSAEELLSVMLLPGEFEGYCEKILEVNGFKLETELVEKVKN